MKFLAILLLALPLGSFAGTEVDGPGETYTTCANGTIYSMGDALVNVDIFDDGVNFYFYETSLRIDNDQMQSGRDPLGKYIRNLSVELSSEGDIYTSIANGLLILSEDKKTATIDMSFDHGEMRTNKLTCEPAKR